MQRIAAILVSGGLMIGLASPALAEDQTMPAVDPHAGQNPVVKSPNNMIDAPLARGQNSFTRSQALARIHSAGYRHVMGLAKTHDGLWRAQAMHKGQTVQVALDYKGNVASE